MPIRKQDAKKNAQNAKKRESKKTTLKKESFWQYVIVVIIQMFNTRLVSITHKEITFTSYNIETSQLI